MSTELYSSKMTSQTAAQVRVHRWGRVVLCILLFGVFVSIAEGIARLNGWTPYRVSNAAIAVNPGGKWFTRHPTLGYSLIPGKFSVTLGARYSFNVTHLPNTLRITHPLDGYVNSLRQKEEIWIFGSDYTYGRGLNDEETYPWLLQERFTEYEVVNFGVGGYGTIHSLIQFREALDVKSPKLAVLAYASFDDKRNTLIRSRRKQVQLIKKLGLGPVFQPYARLDSQDRLQYSFSDAEYHEFPLMRYSALVHFIENLYNVYEEGWYRSQAVSEALVAEMAELAKKRGVKFIVAGINDRPETSEMLAFAQSHGISHVNISVDLHVKENTNEPYDGYPSAIANKKYAERLEPFLRAELSRSTPSMTSINFLDERDLEDLC